MDLYQIRYFLAIAETSNFTKAAERLYVSQPSLSAGIKKLEQELGVSLFERGGRRVILTQAGQYFQEKAQIILKEYQSILYELKGFKDKPLLKLGTLNTIRIGSLASLMRAFRDEHPNTIIELRNGSLEQLDEWLEQGEIDLAVTSFLGTEPSKTALPLLEQRLSLAVPPSHPLMHRSSINLKDLDEQLYITRIHCEIWRTSPHLFSEAGIAPRVVCLADNEEWVIALIQAGLGVSIMPVWEKLAGIVYIPISDTHLWRTLGLKWRNHQESEIVQRFRSFAASHNWQL